MPDEAIQIDSRRVRIGLIFLTVVVFGAIGVATFVDDPLARLLMGAIVLFTMVRAFLLVRSIRRDAQAS